MSEDESRVMSFYDGELSADTVNDILNKIRDRAETGGQNTDNERRETQLEKIQHMLAGFKD